MAVRLTDERGFFVSEASVYRPLKAHDFITSPAYGVIKAANTTPASRFIPEWLALVLSFDTLNQANPKRIEIDETIRELPQNHDGDPPAFAFVYQATSLRSTTELRAAIEELDTVAPEVRTQLSERKELKSEKGVFEYRMTESGKDLRPVVEAMGFWGQKWIEARQSLKNVDPSLLMWDMRRNLNPSPLPDRRTVIQFQYCELPISKRFWWLVVEPLGDVHLCWSIPGSISIFMCRRTSVR